MDLFSVKLKYYGSDDTGRIIKKSDTFIVEAFNYTDMEATITTMVEKYNMTMAEIKSAAPAKYSEIFEDKSGESEIWYKVKYAMIVICENGKESKKNVNVLVQASSIKDAMRRFEDEMKYSSADYNSVSIQETNIVDVLRKSL